MFDVEDPCRKDEEDTLDETKFEELKDEQLYEDDDKLKAHYDELERKHRELDNEMKHVIIMLQ